MGRFLFILAAPTFKPRGNFPLTNQPSVFHGLKRLESVIPPSIFHGLPRDKLFNSLINKIIFAPIKLFSELLKWSFNFAIQPNTSNAHVCLQACSEMYYMMLQPFAQPWKTYSVVVTGNRKAAQA